MRSSISTRMITALLALPLSLAGSAAAQTTFRWVDKEGHVHYADQPPPPVNVRNMEMKQLKGPNVIDTGGAFSYETSQASKNAPLTLYTSDNCAENCKRARDLLARRGAPYTEKMIRTSADADEFRAATGYKDKELVVPLLKAGGRSEKGYEEGAWNRLLDESGYPARGNAKTPSDKEKGKGKGKDRPGS